MITSSFLRYPVFPIVRLAIYAALSLLPLSSFAQETVDINHDGIPDNFATDSIIVVTVTEDTSEEEGLAEESSASTKLQKALKGDKLSKFIDRAQKKHGQQSLRLLAGVSLKDSDDNKYLKTFFRQQINLDEITLEEAIQQMQADPDVLIAEPDYIQTEDIGGDPFYSSYGTWGQPFRDQWYLDLIQAPGAWDQLNGNSNEVIVAVIDSGVDFSHPDLSQVAWANSYEIPNNGVDDDGNGYVDDIYGWNFASNNADSSDNHGHGTLIAGLIGAKRGNDYGIAGIASNVQIMALKNGNSGTSYISDSIEALYYAVRNGAQVVNMSFGGKHYSDSFAQAIRYANSNGVVLIASSGNSGLDAVGHYPSAYPEVISVGASDNNDEVLYFSNYGATVDLVAPGGGAGGFANSMLGPRANGTSMGTIVDAKHTRSAGTSFSAPLVTAAAAMLLQMNPDSKPETIRLTLQQTADDIEQPGWDQLSSHGRLNLNAALLGYNTRPKSATARITSPATGTPAFGTVRIYGNVGAESDFHYLLEYGVGRVPDNWIEISTGSEPHANSLIGSLDVSNFSAGDYTIRLSTFADGLPVVEHRIVLLIGYNESALRPGWSISLVNAEAITVMDLDDDGEQEIFLPTGYGLRMYRPDGSPIQSGLFKGSLVWPSGPASAGDIDGDGELEVGFISKSGTSFAYPEFREIRFWNLDGSTCEGWPLTTPRNNDFVPSSLAPTVVDVNGDGSAEVLFPSNPYKGSAPRLHLVDGAGVNLPGWPKLLTSSANGAFIHATTAAGDIDGDGEIDFVVADSAGYVHALSLDGSYKPGWPILVNSGTSISQEVALSDLNRDGRLDIIVSFYDGYTTVLDIHGVAHQGWPKHLGSLPRSPSIADLDGDGDLEIAIGTLAGELHLLHHDGSSLPNWPKTVSSRIYSPSLADLNQDGALDIIASDGHRLVHAWQVDGSDFAHLGFPFLLPGKFGCYTPPVVKDLDGDGVLEVTVYGDNLEVINTSAIANPSAPSFNHMHANPANTCLYVLPGVIANGQQFLGDIEGGTSIDVSGYGLLAGSTARIGSIQSETEYLSGSGLQITIPSGLREGWHDIWVTSPNSEPYWLTNAVLIVNDIHGDDDSDWLPNGWEWQYGMDPLVPQSFESETGANGDLDKDGVPNFIESIFARNGMVPTEQDAHKLPLPSIENGQAHVYYSLDPKDTSDLKLLWSPDLAHWYSEEDSEYPNVIEHRNLETSTQNRSDKVLRIELPDRQSGFFKWSATQ
ncbi:S8 family serine peptidase [Cerasicoccus fimbriatus]|uniref:S8 family serine peptidase n=1 Tax=Cerasicoccus fimbriatus TaxID=3014554 RepID=UPI0022B4C5CD|nr:S8 family serine peptidase [Cerasicoccus sp. TK19100]